MRLTRIKVETDFEFLLTSMLLHLRPSILNGDKSQDFVRPHVNLCCFDYLLLTTWFLTRCKHFRESSDFRHKFKERTNASPIVVPWHCVDAYLIPSRNRRRLYVNIDCPEWRGLESHRALHVPATPVFSYYSKWVFVESFGHLIVTVAQSKFTKSTAIMFSWVATEGVFGSFCINDSVCIGKPLLVALRLSVILLIDFMDIKEVVYDHLYNLGAVITSSQQTSGFFMILREKSFCCFHFLKTFVSLCAVSNIE